MDIYQPFDDTLSNRPVIIFMHPGSFLLGNNEVDDMVSLSNSSARRGYVACSINYRLGMNILSSYSGERAVYRAVQDLSAAIRFLRENHSIYNINPDEIYVWGSSAGAMAGLHLAFWMMMKDQNQHLVAILTKILDVLIAKVIILFKMENQMAL